MNNICRKISIIIVFTIILTISSTVYAVSDISVNAKAALIVETNTGKIIYEKDMKEKNYPASVTKILTAILTIENCDLNETATVSRSAISYIPTGYVVAPLFLNEEIKIKDLLYALMLKSANDAAYVLAEHVGGSVDGFSDMMNAKAKEIGCKNSHFVNPNGIHNSNHYTTAYDMYLITNYAMKNKTFSKIVSTYQYTLPATNKYSLNNRIMKNTNNFINPNSPFFNTIVKGVKTGTTAQAGNCLITDSFENGLDFITVVLGAQTTTAKFSETKKMIEYAYDNYSIKKIHKKDDILKSIEVKKATKETKNLDLVLSKDISAMCSNEIDLDKIEPEIILNDEITAPIKAGQELGNIKYEVEGIEYTAKLLAKNEVKLKTYYVEIAIGSGIFVALIVVLIVIKKRKHGMNI